MTETTLPKISVVVTCYNCQDYIGDAIRSVARQTLRDFECVIVDDASKDDSVAAIRKKSHIPVVLYIYFNLIHR